MEIKLYLSVLGVDPLFIILLFSKGFKRTINCHKSVGISIIATVIAIISVHAAYRVVGQGSIGQSIVVVDPMMGFHRRRCRGLLVYDVQGRRPGNGRAVADAPGNVAGRLVVFIVVLVVTSRVPPVDAPIAQPRPRQQTSGFLQRSRR